MMHSATSTPMFATIKAASPSFAMVLKRAAQHWLAMHTAAREKQAKAAVRARLARQTDRTLSDLGFASAQIEAIRREAAKGPLPWC